MNSVSTIVTRTVVSVCLSVQNKSTHVHKRCKIGVGCVCVCVCVCVCGSLIGMWGQDFDWHYFDSFVAPNGSSSWGNST